MVKLSVIAGTDADDSQKESVRKSLRKTHVPAIPQCPTCAARTYIEAKTGTLKQKICVYCLKDGNIVVME